MNKIKLIILSSCFAVLFTTIYAGIKELDLYSIEKEGKRSYILGTVHNVDLI